jgi:DNA-binding protein HU-beta
MNKQELVDRMVKFTGTTKKDALKFLDAFLEAVGKELKDNGKVTLAGFGTFKPIHKKQKTGINPKTGVRIIIPPKKAVKFLPGKGLKAFIAGGLYEVAFRGPHGSGDPPD